VLKLLRWLGFLAPIAVGASIAIVSPRAAGMEADELTWTIAVTAVAALAGLATMAVISSIYYTRRLDRLSRALEATLSSEEQVEIPVRGVAAEQRLARAFNAAARAFRQVEAQATRDRLTGIVNRPTLLSALTAEVERANRYKTDLSVAFIDIDRFKEINDSHGHNAGDAVLRHVAELVRSNIRGPDLLGRYGGEEFMLMLPETAPGAAMELAEKLRNRIMQSPVTIPGGERVRATISIGIAGGEGGELRVDQLVEEADSAMYAAKSLGRNRTHLFRSVGDETRVRSAPISPIGRQTAEAIGHWANATAAESLASVLAPEAHHRGRPSDMITALALELGAHLGLPDEELQRIRLASLLHDVGKLAVPASILDKPGGLDESEWQAITQHPRIGQMVLERASSLRDAIPIILHHHERYNGMGYPHGLQGREIPIGARILAIADAYHAIVTDRPYQAARSHLEALAELETHAGTQFDPELVALFVRLFAEQVPSDGLEEVYRLHEEARGGLAQIDRHGQRSGDPAASAPPAEAAG
jgi:diguanylate cyclase (GGDEF)-like protein